MAFQKTYDEIKEMVLRTALDIKMARAIVRKSGLLSGAVNAAAGLTRLPWEFFFPNPHGAYAGLPAIPGQSAELPRRRVQNNLEWPPTNDQFPPELQGANNGSVGKAMLAWNIADTSMTFFKSPQSYANMLHFTAYSEGLRPQIGSRLIETPPRVFEDEPGIQNPGVPKTAVGATFVTGRTYYDPFPFPEAPLYFWADLTDSQNVACFAHIVGVGIRETPYNEVDSAELHSGDPNFTKIPQGNVVLKCWASIDGGASWISPWHPYDINSESGYNAWDLNRDNYYGIQGLTGSEFPIDVPGGTLGTGVERKEIFRDDVLFKFTLETPSTDTWVAFDVLGITPNFVDITHLA